MIAVVPTKGRPEVVRRLINSLAGQVPDVVVVDNNDEPDAGLELISSLRVHVVHRPGYPPNISELLNAGMDAADELARGFGAERWDVGLLNDDVVVPPGWVDSLVGALHETGAAAAYTDRIGRPGRVLQTAIPVPHHESMTCWACAVRGELGIRWDESIKWWYGDNDFDYRCRSEHGGVVAVPGPVPEHTHPSAQTFADAELSRQAHVDQATFENKWRGRV